MAGVEPGLSEVESWRLIDETCCDDPVEHERGIVHALAVRSLDDVWLFGRRGFQMQQRAKTWNLWNAARRIRWHLANATHDDDASSLGRHTERHLSQEVR
jgi:hypothetical protein